MFLLLILIHFIVFFLGIKWIFVIAVLQKKFISLLVPLVIAVICTINLKLIVNSL